MSSQSEGPRFVIQRFDFIGLTLLSESELRDALDSWLGRELTFADLQKALTRVTDLYEEKGWTVRPQLPEQDVGDGVSGDAAMTMTASSLFMGHHLTIT